MAGRKRMSTAGIRSIAEALRLAEPRPPDSAAATIKKNYAERLSRHISTAVANLLRPDFLGIMPDADGRRQESRARTGKGFKKLDVNYSTPELGLGLGVSVKTINFRDAKTRRYTKNYTRVDNELRAEATDYHERQPYAVLIAVVFLPASAATDGKTAASSFAQAVSVLRPRAGRQSPSSRIELFERVFVGLYEPNGEAVFLDVLHPPPRNSRPVGPTALTLEGLTAEIRRTYDERNRPEFQFAEQE